MIAKKLKSGLCRIRVNKNQIFTVVLILFLQSAFCQSYDDNGRKYFESKDKGSVTDITGYTYILSIFASEGDEQWTVEGKKQFMNKEKAAYEWISKEVQAYDKTFSYKRGMYYGGEEDFKLSKRIKISTPDSIKFTRDNVYPMVLEALQSHGFKSTKSFYDYVTSKFGCTNVLVNLYIKGKGQSFAQSCLTTNDSTKFLEITVICELNKWDCQTYTTCIAHETLHLFGGWDLYAVTPDGKENAELAKKQFENSIFLNTKKDINLHNIDELTAWRIGLAEKKDWYLNFIPAHYFYK